MSEQSRIEADLAQAQTAIERARTLLAGGDLVDLTGLDACVATLCDAIGALPADARAGYKPQLVGLIDNLNALVTTLSAQHGEVGSALKGVSSRHRAVSAYGAVPGGGAGRPRPTKKDSDGI